MMKLQLIKSEDTRQLDFYNLEQISNKQEVSSQQSGGSLPIIYIALIDKYGQIVGNDFSSKVRISIQTQNLDEKASKYQPFIEGNTDFQTLGGISVIQNVFVTSNPGSKFYVSFSTDGIDLSKQSNKEYMKQSSKENLDFKLDIQLRECNVGEYFTSAGKCLVCSDNQYSLVKMTQPGSCEICESEKAQCLGGANIGPLPGYWRKSNTTKNIEKCLFQPACLGMVAPTFNQLGDCQEGYRGILCADCSHGYSRDNDYQCKYCPEHWANILRLLAIFIGVVFLIVFMVRSTLNGAKDSNNVTSIYIKILLNHFQLLLITSSFDFSWSQEILQFFGVTSQVGEVSTQVFSIDCFINSNNQDYEKSSDSKRIYFFRLIIIAVFPLVLTVICFLFCTRFMILNAKRLMENQDFKMIQKLFVGIT
ncbi:UNKNOWN [Stylonychia lemnae]|uniref:Transmembrane protein n=1 Tax=Stylonychia lemnae TaxID=5949 RepID=A0A077ZYC6_STYLE|nr:UNKNOWN [Stylonychia lemnae]|eukprot:CDW74850.1 UNKNOWN [Stylonychia lemnae]